MHVSNLFQDSLGADLAKVKQDKEEVITRLRSQLDELHNSLDEANAGLNGLNEKLTKLEGTNKDLETKLETKQTERSKLGEELRIKVCLFFETFVFTHVTSR